MSHMLPGPEITKLRMPPEMRARLFSPVANARVALRMVRDRWLWSGVWVLPDWREEPKMKQSDIVKLRALADEEDRAPRAPDGGMIAPRVWFARAGARVGCTGEEMALLRRRFTLGYRDIRAEVREEHREVEGTLPGMTSVLDEDLTEAEWSMVGR